MRWRSSLLPLALVALGATACSSKAKDADTHHPDPRGEHRAAHGEAIRGLAFVYVVEEGDPKQVAETFERFAESLGADRYRVTVDQKSVRAEISANQAMQFKDAVQYATGLTVFTVRDDIDPQTPSPSAGAPGPAGFTLLTRTLPTGPDKNVGRKVACAPIAERAALEAYLRTATLPADVRFQLAKNTTNVTPDERADQLCGLVTDAKPFLEWDRIESTTVDQDPYDQRWRIVFTFDSAGATALENTSKAWMDRRIALFVDGVASSTPVVKGVLSGGKAMLMGFDEAPARALAARIERGPIPGKVALQTENRLDGDKPAP